MSTATIVPRPPRTPRPEYLPKRRAGTRYVKPGCLPPLEKQFATVPGLSKRNNVWSVSSTSSRPVAGNNPARHTAKSRARAAFLEGERAKFDEMFPPLRKDAPPYASDGEIPHDLSKERILSRETSVQTLHSDDSKQGERSIASTTSRLSNISSMGSSRLSYSEVTSGVFKHYTQPAATQEQHRFPERPHYPIAAEQQHPDMDQQHHHPDMVQEWSDPAMVQQQCYPGAEQQQRYPEVVQQHCYPGTVQPQPYLVPVQRQPCPLTLHQQQRQPCPLTLHQQPCAVPVQRQACPLTLHQQPCAVPVQQQICPVPVQQPFCPVLVPLHSYIGPVKKQHYPQEDFETLLARRKEEYARARAEKEKYAELVDRMQKMVREHEAFLADHPDQLAKIELKKSVDVEEAERARRVGDVRREFDVYKAHLQDLFYNKAQLITQLNKEKKEEENTEEKIRAEIEKVQENDEIIIERKVQLLHGMLNEVYPSDDESEEEEYDDEDGESSEEEVYREEGNEENEEEQEAFDRDEGVYDREDDTHYEVYKEPMLNTGGGMPSIHHSPVSCCQNNTCHSDGQQRSDHMSGDGPFQSRDQLLKELDDLATDVEEDVLEQLAKFGRLLQLETAHNGRDNSEMMGLIESLHTVIESEQEARVDQEDEDVSTPNDNDAQADLVVDNEAGVDENAADAVDEGEEEPGPILPAFTSTSINTSCADSKATFEALRSNSSTLNEPSRAEHDVPSQRSEETTDRGMAKESAKNGKKQVSFVSEENVQQHRSNITFYANMSVNDLAELVSSALVTDIMPYASESKAFSGTDKSTDLDSASDPSVIAVKYVSVMTTEKDKTTLRPVFAKKHESKLNTLSFTITGEILLSSPTSDARGSSNQDETVAADGVGMDHRVKCATVEPETVDRGGTQESASSVSKKTDTSDTTREIEAAGENESAEGADISQTSVESQSAANVDSGVTVEYQTSEETELLPESTDIEMETFEEFDTPVTSLEAMEQSSSSADACSKEAETDTGGVETERAVEQTNDESSALTETDTGAVNRTDAETTEKQTNEESFARTNEENSAKAVNVDSVAAEAERAEKQTSDESPTAVDADNKRSLIESDGLRIEFDVAAMCSAMCKAIPHVLNQMAIETATHSLTLDKTAFMRTETATSEQRKSPAQEVENTHTCQDLGDEGVCTCDKTVASSSGKTEEEKSEQAPALYAYRLVTPSSFNVTPELMKEMTAPRKCCDSTKCDVSECTGTTCFAGTGESIEGSTDKALVPFDSQIITLKAFDRAAEDVEVPAPTGTSSETETKSGVVHAERSSGENTESALVPFDSQIVTIKAFKTAQTATPYTATVATREDDAASHEAKVGEEKALVPFDSQIVTLKVLKTCTKQPIQDGRSASQENGEVEMEGMAKPNSERSQVTTSVDAPEIEDQTPSIKDMEEHGTDGSVPTETVAHKKVTSGSDDETTEPLTHKSLPSFRRADLEKAVNPPDKHGVDENKFRRTKSKPVLPLMEPLLPRRAKMNTNIYQTHKSNTTRSGPLKAESRVMVKQLSRQSTTRAEKHETVQETSSRVKSSKSFRSHSSLVTADMNQPHTSHQSKPDKSNKQLETAQASATSMSRQDGNCSSYSIRSAEAAARPVKLYKPRSLPATIREVGDRLTRKMRKVQSEGTSAVPKLPKL